MDLLHGLSDCGQRFKAGSVLSIGNFDGVHLGHQSILRQLTQTASKRGLTSVLMTFEPHPVQVLFPERRLQRLFPVRDLEEQVARQNVDVLLIEPFTKQLASLEPQEFLEKLLVPRLRPKHLVVGDDFSFGAGRAGNLEFLADWCRQHQVNLEIQAAVEVDGERVSSRRTRQLVQDGEMEKVARFLARPFYLEGAVQKGAGRGRTIGVPTVNMSLQEFVAPKTGVYVTATWVAAERYLSVSNLGVRPTFGGTGDITLETHLFDFQGDLYGRIVRVEFLRFLRAERKFSSVDELRVQIQKDIATAKRWPG